VVRATLGPVGGTDVAEPTPVRTAWTGVSLQSCSSTLNLTVTRRILLNLHAIGLDQRASATASVLLAGQLEVAGRGRPISGHGAAPPPGRKSNRKHEARTGLERPSLATGIWFDWRDAVPQWNPECL